MSKAALQSDTKGISTASILDAVKVHADPRPGLDWLDVGCGTGDLLRWLVRDHSPGRLVGIDVLPWLEEDLKRAVEYRVGAAEDELPLAGRFDRILMAEVLEHVEAPWTLLRAAAMSLRPGGRLVITTPNIFSLRSLLDVLLRGQAERLPARPHLPPHPRGRACRHDDPRRHGAEDDVHVRGRGHASGKQAWKDLAATVVRRLSPSGEPEPLGRR